MAKDARSVSDVLRQATETLRTAQRGLEDLRAADPSRRMPGLRNAIVFGRAVTNVLENLRGRVANFDDWYKPETQQLSRDPGFRRLYEMRSEILKEGALGIGPAITIDYLNTADLQDLLRNPPPGARGFFIGTRMEAPAGRWSCHLEKSRRSTFSCLKR
jgi:hypothetical protein